MGTKLATLDVAAAAGSRRVGLQWRHAIITVALAALVGLAVWNVMLLRSGGDDDLQGLASQSHLVSSLQARGVRGGGVVLYLPDEKKALVIADGIAPLDAAQSTYQLWQVDNGRATSAGFLDVGSDGHAVAIVRLEGRAGEILSISIEPQGGSKQPTTQPVFATALDGSPTD